MKRDAVAERVRDDYGIELSEIMDEFPEQGQRQEIESEIGELRRKISNIGAVNMESLEELEDLGIFPASMSEMLGVCAEDESPRQEHMGLIAMATENENLESEGSPSGSGQEGG